MQSHNHRRAANAAIFGAILADHSDFDDGWMDKIPEDAPLNYSDDQAWRYFLGEVVGRYREWIAPCTCSHPHTFYNLKSKELRELRDALLGETQCQ